VSQVSPIDPAGMIDRMVRFHQSFIDDELNLLSSLLDGVLIELRPPRIHGPSSTPDVPRYGQISPVQLKICGLAILVHWSLGCRSTVVLRFGCLWHFSRKMCLETVPSVVVRCGEMQWGSARPGSSPPARCEQPRCANRQGAVRVSTWACSLVRSLECNRQWP
jgi:hypothetical protein